MNNSRDRLSLIIFSALLATMIMAFSFYAAAGNSEKDRFLFHPTSKRGPIDRSDDPTIVQIKYTGVKAFMAV